MTLTHEKLLECTRGRVLSLYLVGKELMTNDLDVLGQFLCKNAIEELEINGHRRVDWKHLFDIIGTSDVLAWIRVRHYHMQLEGANHMAVLLKINTTLTCVELMGCSIDDDSCESIGTVLQSNTHIVMLNLSVNRIGSAGCKHIATALENNHTLKQLDLTSNRIGDEGCIQLAATITHNNTLARLRLSDNNIGNTAARAMSAALKINFSLMDLIILPNSISADDQYVLYFQLSRNTTIRIDRISRYDLVQTLMIGGKITKVPKHLMCLVHKYI